MLAAQQPHRAARPALQAQRSPLPSALHHSLIQRKADNWSKFKNFAKGQGRGFADDQQWWLNEMNPAHHRGAARVGAPLLTTPFAALQMGLSGVGRGLATLGAGAYYGTKGLGQALYGGGKAAVGGLKSTFAPANPHQYDRERLPTRGYVAANAIKPAAVVGASAGTGVGLMGGGGSGLDSAGTAVGGGMISAFGMIPALNSWYKGNKRQDEAGAVNDYAGKEVGALTASQGKIGALGGVMGMAGAGVGIGTALTHGSGALMTADKLVNGAQYASTGLGVAGGALGIATGTITAAQGLWQSGGAAKKLWALRGASLEMLSQKGEVWKNRIKDREKAKLGLNSLKVLGGALGIAAGALLIASNPVGWALGLAGALTLGGLAAYKIYQKVKKYHKKQKNKDVVRQAMAAESAQAEQAVPQAEQPELDAQVGDASGRDAPAMGGDGAEMAQADPANLSPGQRKQGVELANRVAQRASKSAKVAGEMIAALRMGNPTNLVKALSQGMKWSDFKHFDNDDADAPVQRVDVEALDAATLLNVLKITPSTALSPSGQELIEKKMSATDTL
jgi:hypothetical protein